MFKSLLREAPAGAACQRIEALARAHFGLGDETQVRVDERATTQPGCPPRETVLEFWTDVADGSTQHHRCKVFKPADEISTDDLPPCWMKNALAVPPDWACDCC